MDIYKPYLEMDNRNNHEGCDIALALVCVDTKYNSMFRKE